MLKVGDKAPKFTLPDADGNSVSLTNFSGKKFAILVQMEWDKRYKNKIKWIIGDEWYGGNLSYHLKSRPKWNYSEDRDRGARYDKHPTGIIYVGDWFGNHCYKKNLVKIAQWLCMTQRTNSGLFLPK